MKVVHAYSGDSGDKVAFIAFLNESGIEDVAKIEELWQEGTTAEVYLRKPSSSDWEKVQGLNVPAGITAQFFFNRKANKLRFKLKSG